MAVVHVRAGCTGGVDELFGAVDEGLRCELDDVTRVGEGRNAGCRSELCDGEILIGIHAWRVAHDHADPDRPGSNVGCELIEDPSQLRVVCGLLPLDTDDPPEDRTGTTVERPVRNDVHPSSGPRCREAVVDRRTPLCFTRIGTIDRGTASFELQRRRHPIASLQPPSRQRLSMAVHIDEPGRHDQPGHVKGHGSVEAFPDCADPPTVEPNVAEPIKPTHRIHYTTTGQHHVVKSHHHRLTHPATPRCSLPLVVPVTAGVVELTDAPEDLVEVAVDEPVPRIGNAMQCRCGICAA